MKNKRGQFELIGLAIISVVALILIAIFFLSSTFRFVAIGTALIIMAFVVLLGKGVKKSNVKVGVFITLIAVGFVLIFASGVMQSIQPFSITDASYNNGKVLIYASIQGANAIDIQFSPSVLNNFLSDDNVKATKTSRLTAEVINPSISFNYVTNYDNPVNSIEKIGETTNILGSRLTECRQKYPNTDFAVRQDTFFGKLNCYQYVAEGYINSFSTGQTKSNNIIRFNLDGVTKDISSDNTQVSFNGATITWRGNLISNTFITNPQYQVYRIGNDIRLVQSGADSKARTEYNAFEQCILDRAGSWNGVGISDFTYCEDRYNNKMKTIIADKESEYISNTQGIKSIDTISNGVLKANLDAPTFISTFTIELDATKVGIVKLSGIPKITSCANDVSIDGSGSGNEKITIKNTGESSGYFIFETSTNNPYTSCNINPVTINSGSTKTLDVFYSGSIRSKADVSGGCNIKVYDSNDKSSYDTCNFNINVKYEPFTSECTNEGESKCSADKRSIITCENGFFISTLCNNSCEIKENKGVCIGIGLPPPKDECAWYEDTIPSYTAEDCGILNWKKITPFVNCEQKTYDSQCKTPATWIYWVIISLVIGSLGAYAIYTMKPKRRYK